VNFWDSSAILPLLVREAKTSALRALYESEPEIVAWWGTTVECVSALARLERDGQMDAPAVSAAIRQLNLLAEQWHEVQPVEPVRQTAARLLRVHSLRAADSLQLAAALVASDQRPGAIPFVCLDQRLRTAAEREGFPVVVGV
jgi:predicted nucleic acid-binding protein